MLSDEDKRQIWRHVYGLEFHRQSVAFCELLHARTPITSRQLAENPQLVVAPLRMSDDVAALIGEVAQQAADLAVKALER